MEEQYFDDLTEITCPPAFLDDDTFQRLEAWPHGREYWSGERWIRVDWALIRGHSVVYRARPAPLTQDTIPWHLLDDRLKMAVRQSVGVAYAAASIDVNPSVGGFTVSGLYMRVDLLKGYQRGTCDWKNSLQHRPEGA